MKALDFLSKLILFTLLTSKTTDAVLPVLPILGTAMDVISFGIDIYSFFDSILGDDDTQSTPAPIDYDRIIDRISERIELSTETVVFRIELQAYISELRGIALTIKQLLAEMEEIIKAKSKDTRTELQRRFLNNFERHKTEMYKIKSLLTFRIDVSGISNTLLSLVANEFACGMTKLEEFQNYYMTLVSDVVALALLKERLSETSLYNQTLASWQTSIKSLFHDIEQQKNECKANFAELMAADFESINDPQDLFENNQNRYPYKETDVLYLGGSYCVWSLKSYSSILKKMEDDKMTFVFVNGFENVPLITVEQLQKIVLVAKFKNCLASTDKIISYFDVLGEDLVFWLTFPQDQAADFKILLHQNSTAMKITTETDGTKFTTIVYLRAQDKKFNSTLAASDFDVRSYDKPVTVEESTGLKTWQLGLIIGGSALVVIIVIVVICCRCCCSG